MLQLIFLGVILCLQCAESCLCFSLDNVYKLKGKLLKKILQKLAAARYAQLLQKCVAKKIFCKSLLLHNSNAQPLQKWLRNNTAAVKTR